MKIGFLFMTVLAVVAMLLTGCTVPGAPSPAATPGAPTPSAVPDTPTPTTQPPSPGLSTGTIRVLVTDAPSYRVDNVTVYFSRVEVHKAADGSGGDGGWIEIPLDVPDDQTFDDTKRIELNSEMGKVILAKGQIEAGKYTQIRVYMDEDYEDNPVEVTYKECDDCDAVTVEAKLASGKLKFVRPFEVVAGGDTTILLDFDLQKSVVFTGASQSDEVKVIVKPVVKLQITLPESALSLEITEPEDGDEFEEGESTVKVSGTVSPPGAKVTVNDVEVDVDENDGTFEHEIELTECENTITVVAKLGKETVTEEITVYYKPECPE